MNASPLKDLRKLMREMENEYAFQNFSIRLKRERSDRALVMLCASFIDVGLKTSIAMRLPNKEAALSLFEQHGPLCHLGAKIKMAEAMALFGSVTKQNLNIIQTVRNAFAHSLLVTSFKTPEILKACNALELPFGGARSPFFGKGKVKFKTPRQKFVAVSVLTVESVIFYGMEFEDDDGVNARIPKLP